MGQPGAADDAAHMRRALALAERGRRTVSPNPLVGCVLVRDGAVVGEGWHARAGGPHAEVVALRAAGEAARGATAYVTLEPCAHAGRTPPCSDALREAGVARVVVATADPHHLAKGGAEALEAAGIAVEVGLLGDEARAQNEVFLHGVATGRPFVVAKAATSLDGRIAAADGTSRWLTGAEARARAHALRAEVDAVLVGSGTVLADDPELTVRLPDHDGPQPLRVVLDARGRVGADHRVTADGGDTVVYTTPPDHDLEDPAESVGAGGVGPPAAPQRVLESVPVRPADDGVGVALDAVLADLWDRDVRSLLVEGGASVLGAFLRAGLVDRLEVHVAPLLLGAAGRPLLDGPWATTLADAPRFTTGEVVRLGDDVVLALRPVRTPVREEV